MRFALLEAFKNDPMQASLEASCPPCPQPVNSVDQLAARSSSYELWAFSVRFATRPVAQLRRVLEFEQMRAH